MSEDLGARLVRAGLVTREELADALASGAEHGGILAAALVRGGLDEEALAGFFLSEGFGPLLRSEHLLEADGSLAARLPARLAQALLALPVRSTRGGVVVAMADPSDRHAVQELARVLAAAVVPSVARVTDLRGELVRRFAAELPAPEVDDDAPIDLVRKRTPPVIAKDGSYAGSTHGEERERARAAVRPVIEVGDADESAMPLVRMKPFSSPPSGFLGRTTPPTGATLPPPTPQGSPSVPPREGERERTQTRDKVPALTKAAVAAALAASSAPAEPATSDAPAVPDAPVAAAPTLAVQPTPALPAAPAPEIAADAPPEHVAPQVPASADLAPLPSIPADALTPSDAPTVAEPANSEDRWGDLAPPPSSPPPAWSKPDKTGRAIAKVATTRIARRRGAATEVGPSSPPGEIGTILAGIRASSDRDEAVRLACEGALTVARSAVFLALRKGVLRGREAVGAGVSREGIRNLWIPATSPSVFREVVTTGVAYAGPYGTAAADAVFRAAVASRGGHLLAQPIVVGSKVVGLLCADDVRHADIGRSRVEALAHAVGDAFERVIVAGKS